MEPIVIRYSSAYSNLKTKTPLSWLKIIKKGYPNRKALLSLYATAILAFRWTVPYQTSPVFHADQRGMGGFLIRTLGPEFQGYPHPHGVEDGPRTLAPGSGSKIYAYHVDQHEKLKGLGRSKAT